MNDHQVVVSESYKNGKRVNAQQRRDNAEIDKKAEAWREDDSELITTANVLIEIDGVECLVPRHLAYTMCAKSEARFIGSEVE